MKRRRLLALTAPLPFAGGRTRAQAGAPRLLAQAALRDTAGYLSIVAAVDGVACSFLLDTGADAGLLAPPLAERLGLPRPRGARARFFGMGEVAVEAPVAIVRTLALDPRFVLRDVPVPLGTLPAAPAIDPPVAGLIGGDLLSRFAVEIDVAGGTLRLFEPLLPSSGPASGVPPWTGRFSTLPLRRLGNRVAVAVRLDGRPLLALLDTGARSRIVSVRAAAVAPDVLAGEVGGLFSGVEGGESVYHWHRFRDLAVGDEVARAPVLTVAPLAGDADMLLGSDWFAGHQVWLSYSTGYAFVRPVA